MADRALNASRAATAWRSLKGAAWLGWQIESNWTTPVLFAVYAVAKPLALAGILVAIYGTVTHGDFTAPEFTDIYLGNAFYLYVGAVMTGMAYAVIDDRERYRMLKSMYVAPIDIRVYLIGRGIARFATGSAAVAITLIVGILLLHVHVHLFEVNWLLFLLTLLTGIVMLAMLGLILAGAMLLLGHLSWAIGDAVSGALFLFSGAVFPLTTLPPVLRPVGFALPITYWLELVRRALVGTARRGGFRTFDGYSNVQLLVILAGQTLLVSAVALMLFRICDAVARERGLIDRTTNY